MALSETPIDPRDFGRLEAEVQNLQEQLRLHREESRAQIQLLAAKIEALVEMANQTKGGWRTLLLLSGIAGTVGAFLAKMVTWLK